MCSALICERYNLQQLFASKPEKLLPSQNFLNLSNLKSLIYPILYEFDDNAFLSKVYTVELKQSLFTSKSGEALSFYFEDLWNIAKGN